MEFIETLFDVISEFGSEVLGFFTAFIEATTSQISAGNVFIAVLIIIIIWIKLRKMF